MPRAPNADPAKTIDDLTDAALELLSQQPSIDSLALRPVAKRANVTLGTLQYYFSSKEELLETCLDGYYNRLSELAQELLVEAATATDGEAMLDSGVRRMYRFCLKERGLIIVRMATRLKRGELHPRRQREFMGDAMRFAATTLAPHITINEQEMVMSIQAIASLIVRFVQLTDAEVEILTEGSTEEPRVVAEDFVVRAALRLVRPGL